MLSGALALAAPEIKAPQSELADGKAQIYEAKGEVRILKKDSDQWMTAEKGMVLEAGLDGFEEMVDTSDDLD